MKRHNESKQNRKKGASTSQLSKLPPVNNNSRQKKLSLPQNFNFNGSTYQDQGLVGLLHQYFIKHDFVDTLQSFQRDCSKGFKSSNKVQNILKDQIITAFDSGHRQSFVTKFSQFVPMSMRAKDPQTMRMQFYLHVYFFVFSIHPQLGRKKIIDQVAKQNFINYLQGRGAALAKDSQFLQYYALAYLPKPQQHPNFRAIFTKDWIGQLRQRLAYFLDKLYPAGKKPVLINMYDKFIEKSIEGQQSRVFQQDDLNQRIEQQIEMENRSLKQSRQQGIEQNMEIQMLQKKIGQLEQDKNELVNLIEGSNKKYQSLQNTYKDFVEIARQNLIESQMKWFQITQQFFAIASDLLDSCKKLQQGIPLQDNQIIQRTAKKLNKYESFINMNVQDLLSDNVDFSMFERTEHDISTDLIKRNSEYRSHQLIQLNFVKVNNVLISQVPEEVQQKAFLMQALRWRISKTRGLIQKRQAVMSYILFDIFGLKRNDGSFTNLIKNPNQTVVTQTARLLSVFAKDYYARQYMVSPSCMKNCLITLMAQETNQTAQSYLIMTLQQISIRAKAQTMMIENGLIKWLVLKMSKDRQIMQTYLMSYMSTLLLNLLLRKQGLDKSEEIKQDILRTLIDLMEYQATQVRSYAHGALYPLLSRKIFRDKAKQYGMQENIKYLKSNDPPSDILTQLGYLQSRLQLTQDDQRQEQEEDDEDNDVDEVAPEEQYEEDITENQITGSLQGQQLLMKKYSLMGPQSISQMNAIREEVGNSLKRRSVFGGNSFYQRSSANTPMMGKLRRNISNNNSVYSNRSANNRVLRSEMRNRESNLTNKNEGSGNSVSRKGNQRLDTVHQNNSELSMRELMEQKQMGQGRYQDVLQSRQREGDLFIGSQHKIEDSRGRMQDSRGRMQGSGGIESQNQERVDTPNLYQIDKNQEEIQQNPINKHYYQKNKEYQDAFKTRALLVRTPPQK